MVKERRSEKAEAKSPKRRRRITRQEKDSKSGNPYFEGIRDSLIEVTHSLEKGKKLTCREVHFPEPPEEMNAKEIVELREKKMNLSQHLFALLLNVSPKTVQAWEQNLNTPSGAALRLLWLVRQKPDLFRSIIPTVAKTKK